MPFDGKEIEVVRDAEGNPWIGVRSVCLAIGVSPNRQIEKIQEDSRFNWSHMLSVAADGKNREVFCIPLLQLNGWLFGINPNKVSESVRQALIAYQNECFGVLYKHFMPRGEAGLQPFFERLETKIDAMHAKFDHLVGMDATVFGDDAPTIKALIEEASQKIGITHQEVWGLIRRECDVSSYKLQNKKVIKFLRTLLGYNKFDLLKNET